MRRGLIFLFVLVCFCGKAQFPQTTSYYSSLVKLLSDPDTLYVYEVASSWGSGIAYITSFKNATVTSGYWISKNFTQRHLLPRNLLPPDSIAGTERLVIIAAEKADSILAYISRNDLFKKKPQTNSCCAAADVIDDGATYTLTKITADAMIIVSCYEIYHADPTCPLPENDRLLIGLDQLYQQHFPTPAVIIDALLAEYRARQK